MRLTIFGARGKIGSELVRQALQAGHEVRAFVRDPSKLNLADENIVLVRGDRPVLRRLRDIDARRLSAQRLSAQ